MVRAKIRCIFLLGGLNSCVTFKCVGVLPAETQVLELCVATIIITCDTTFDSWSAQSFQSMCWICTLGCKSDTHTCSTDVSHHVWGCTKCQTGLSMTFFMFCFKVTSVWKKEILCTGDLILFQRQTSLRPGGGGGSTRGFGGWNHLVLDSGACKSRLLWGRGLRELPVPGWKEEILICFHVLFFFEGITFEVGGALCLSRVGGKDGGGKCTNYDFVWHNPSSSDRIILNSHFPFFLNQTEPICAPRCWAADSGSTVHIPVFVVLNFIS